MFVGMGYSKRFYCCNLCVVHPRCVSTYDIIQSNTKVVVFDLYFDIYCCTLRGLLLILSTKVQVTFYLNLNTTNGNSIELA